MEKSPIKEVNQENNVPEKEEIQTPAVQKVNQEQIHELLFGQELSWQAIIYDLINSEQLDPWDIDILLLTKKYLEKIHELEEADFFVSSKVLLAATLLLKLKSEILLNSYIKSLDEVLFGKKEAESKPIERIEIDENEIPLLYPKTPLPRHRKISIEELMSALNKAIKTETRRIKREIEVKHREREADIVLPKKKITVHDKIKQIYEKLQTIFKSKTRISYSDLVGKNRDEKIVSFLPVLHLDAQKKVWLTQKDHFDEIWLWMFSHYKSKEKEKLRQELMGKLDETRHQLNLDREQKKRMEKINKDFQNPLADLFNSFD